MQSCGFETAFKAIAGHNGLVIIPRVFIRLSGDFESAVFLNRIAVTGPDGVEMTFQDWEDQCMIPRRAIERATRLFCEVGILNVTEGRRGRQKLFRYMVDMSVLSQAVAECLESNAPLAVPPVPTDAVVEEGERQPAAEEPPALSPDHSDPQEYANYLLERARARAACGIQRRPPRRTIMSIPESSVDAFAVAFDQILGPFIPRDTSRSMTDGMRRMIKARLLDRDLEWWISVFRKSAVTRFLLGGNDIGFRASFSWFFTDTANAQKVMDGSYDGIGPKVQPGPAESLDALNDWGPEDANFELNGELGSEPELLRTAENG